jgi:uncharacterized repeat protein (TIGR01451 family)
MVDRSPSPFLPSALLALVLAGAAQAQQADLSITKTDFDDPIAAGSIDGSYTVTVTNNGPNPATAATWTDTLPAGVTFDVLGPVAGWSCTTPMQGQGGTIECSNPSFAVGSSVFQFAVHIDSGLADGTVISNTATTASSTPDPVAGNNSATETTTVFVRSDLSVGKTAPQIVFAGQDLSYSISVSNAGESDSGPVTMSDFVPSQTTFVSFVAAPGWSCTTPAAGGTGLVLCSAPALEAFQSAAFTLVVRGNDAMLPNSQIFNTATTTTATDPFTTNNIVHVDTFVLISADLSVAKTVSPEMVAAGDGLTYAITLTNAGPSASATTSFADPLPAGTTFVSLASPAGWSCTTPAVGSSGAVSCSRSTAFSPGSAAFTLVVAVDEAAAPGSTITNTVTATWPNAGPNGIEATAVATVLGPTGGGTVPVVEVPALGARGIMALALLLASLALFRLRR